MFPWEVLIVSSDIEGRRELQRMLRRENIDPLCAASTGECREILAASRVGLIFCDDCLTGGDYRDVLAFCRALRPKTRVVVTSSVAGWDDYLEAMRLGAFDVIVSPCRPTDVEWMVIQARRDERGRLRQLGTENLSVESNGAPPA